MSMPPPPPDTDTSQVTSPPGNGAIAWICGLIVLLCVPFLGSVLAGGLMIGLGLAQRGKGGLAEHNGIRAANWGLTYLVATVVLVGGHFLMLWFLTRDGGSIDHFFPFGLIIISWGLVSFWHLIVCIWGSIVTSQNRPFTGTGVPVFRSR